MEPWIEGLPPVARASVVAFADPHPPGSRARAKLAGEALVEVARSWPRGQPGLAREIHALVENLTRVGQTTMHQPGVTNMLSFLLAEGVPEDPGKAAALLAGRAEQANTAMDSAVETIAAAGAELLHDGDHVLVHDYADSRQLILARAADQGKTLTVLAPACRTRRADGVRAAREAHRVGHRAIVVTDAAIGWAMSRVALRAAFLGADALMPDGTVLATPGALAVASVGADQGVPVYVSTDLWKVTEEFDPGLEALNLAPDPDGVLEATDWAREGLEYYNPLVDYVPGRLLAGLVTEAGIIAASEVGATAERLYGFGPRSPVASGE